MGWSCAQTKLMRVDVETVSEISSGQTVCDFWEKSSRPKNAVVAQSMDVPGFWDLVCAAVTTADDIAAMNTDATLQPELKQS